MKLKLALTLLFALIPLSVIAESHDAIKAYEMRLHKVEQRLEKIDSPIQQMGGVSAFDFDSMYDDVQMSFDDVSGRLAMIRLIMSGSAPKSKQDLAKDELRVLEADMRELEDQSASLSNDVDEAVWY